MIFHAPHLLLSLRWLVPGVLIFGSSPNHAAMCTLFRLVTIPFSHKAVWKFHHMLSAQYLAFISFFYDQWSNVEFIYYGDPLPSEEENALYISNHQCTVDWLIADDLCFKVPGRTGKVRYILKNTIKYLPLFGWHLGDMGNIYVKRGDPRSKEKIKEKLLWYKQNEVPLWLVIFPEGTRYNPNDSKKMNKSWNFSDSIDRPRLNHVLAPHHTGFVISLNTLRNYFDAIYDVTVIYEGTGSQAHRRASPSLFGFFTGNCSKVHVHFRRVSIDNIPLDSKEQESWLYNSFIQKDRLIDEFVTTGKISSPTQPCLMPLRRTLPPTLFYIGVLAILMSSQTGRKGYLGMTMFLSLVGFIMIKKF